MSQSINALLSRIQRDLKINVSEMLSDEGKEQLREAITTYLCTSKQETFNGVVKSADFSFYVHSWGMSFASSCYHTDTYCTDSSKEMCDIIQEYLKEFGSKWITEQY